MIPLIFLYDENIDRPKLSEQKNPFEYIVPPHKWGRTVSKFLKQVQRLVEEKYVVLK